MYLPLFGSFSCRLEISILASNFNRYLGALTEMQVTLLQLRSAAWLDKSLYSQAAMSQVDHWRLWVTHKCISIVVQLLYRKWICVLVSVQESCPWQGRDLHPPCSLAWRFSCATLVLLHCIKARQKAWLAFSILYGLTKMEETRLPYIPTVIFRCYEYTWCNHRNSRDVTQNHVREMWITLVGFWVRA